MPAVASEEQRRLYLADLDSVRQVAAVPGPAETWTEASPPAALRGVLRMAVLMGGRLVVSDTQLFDGRVFLALGAEGFGRLVSAHASAEKWPLEVFLRRDTLAQTLRSLVAPADEPEVALRPFRFSVVEDAAVAAQAAELLSRHTAGDLDRLVEREGETPAGLGALLSQCGVPLEQCRALAARWRGWIAAEQLFVVQHASANASIAGHAGDWHVARVSRRLAALAAPVECHDALRLLSSEDSPVVTRSQAYDQVLDPLDALGGGAAAGAEEIRAWVDAWYHRAQAESLDADVLESALTHDDQDAWDHRHRLVLGGELASQVGAMPPEVFAVLRYRTRSSAYGWWRGGRRARRRSQRQLAFTLRETTTPARFSERRRQAVTSALVLVLAVLVTDVHHERLVVHVVVVALAALLSALPALFDVVALSGRRLDRLVAVRQLR